MEKYELEERLIEEGLALTSARGIKQLTDAVPMGEHVYGYSPAEIVMNSLASCLMVNIQKISKKMRLVIDGIDVKITAYRRSNPPKILKMEYLVSLQTNVEREKIDRLMEYALKYSTVYNTLKDAVEITGKVEI
ncbi:OsmC family protein [Mesoaciditoga lauensis]|uniref:OsmC family protein n=1 Tax=Mesoaciditoga lauensis TaxID=1495039 RepID=UPI00056387F6|nr:OsmC family protein [Mesoaciditoga lauensis]